MTSDEIIADVFSALANPNRLRIVRFLKDGERCQCEIPDQLDIEQSNVSRHIKLLVDAGVLRSRKDGKKMMLSIKSDVFLQVINQFEELVAKQAEDIVAALLQEN